MVVELKDVRRAYGDNVVLDKVDLLIERGDRVALVGPNGAGKSTLMRIFAGVDHPDAGARVLGHNVVIDYFAQDQASVLTTTRTVYEEMTAASPTTMVPMIRNILGGFLFSGDDVYKKAGVLSGGERNRLALAKMLLNAEQPADAGRADEPPRPRLQGSAAGGAGRLRGHADLRLPRPLLRGQAGDQGGGGRRAARPCCYPGGYEDFLYWKKQREAGARGAAAHALRARMSPTRSPPRQGFAAAAPSREARPGDSRRRPPRSVPRPKTAPAPAYDPLAPRLRPPTAADRRAREKRGAQGQGAPRRAGERRSARRSSGSRTSRA